MALSPFLRLLGCAALAVSLAACGDGRSDPLVQGVRTIVGATGLGGGAVAATGPALTAATVPPAVVAQLQGPLILVEATRLGSASLMTRVGQNGPDATWRSPEDWGITLGAGGLLRSTRGLGFDLMATDVRPVAAALAARRTGPVDRLMVRLDGEAQELREVHSCTLRLDGPEPVVIAGASRSLTRMTETCQAGADRYENIYRLDSAGRTIQSDQWVGPEIGHLRITRLKE
ncbi:YjbF family lipoprotein [Roseicyclus persicicus]|uniref:YjbF family lipoprotein n=1 Tax=Roseicyclus persicicus TaxID=2650661 RepID=A0A7X6GWV1_9RHOB|nr:YjbF family lipoprotein [Roseibacterium persicicum]NKX43831.1 YjbF family lipoprotein [Roseibacterium persicicum]